MRVLKSWYTAEGPEHEIRRCFADGLNQSFVSSEAQATISQGDVTILWSPDVDYQLMGQRAFYFRGPKEWNGLPDNIRNTKDIDSFKRRLFNRIFHTK